MGVVVVRMSNNLITWLSSRLTLDKNSKQELIVKLNVFFTQQRFRLCVKIVFSDLMVDKSSK